MHLTAKCSESGEIHAHIPVISCLHIKNIQADGCADWMEQRLKMIPFGESTGAHGAHVPKVLFAKASAKHCIYLTSEDHTLNKLRLAAP
jgi:hypothetical protein